MSLEGATKDIKDERQPMGKRDTVVSNGWEKIWDIKKSRWRRSGTLLTTTDISRNSFMYSNTFESYDFIYVTDH